MSRPPNLTETQKRRLGQLEPKLRRAAKSGNLKAAKSLCADLQSLLRPTGHHTRLFQNKNYLFEAAMEAGEIDLAISGFEGIRTSVNHGTRIYLEATSLLAICRLRKNDFEGAKPLMKEVLQDEDTIKSLPRRREFRRRVIQRFDEEGALSSLRNCGTDSLDPNEVQNEAGILVAGMSEDEILLHFGEAVPERTIQYLYDLDAFSRKQLPGGEQKFLPSPDEKKKKQVVAQTIFSSTRRVLWHSLCDSESDTYKAWVSGGIGAVLDKKFVSSAVISTLSGFGIGIKALAVSATALIIKFGIDVYCDMNPPDDIMTAREVRKKPKSK